MSSVLSTPLPPRPTKPRPKSVRRSSSAMTSSADMKSAPVSVLLDTASTIVAKQTKGSCVFDSAMESQIPRFEAQELTLGRVLGRGGFCVVREVDKIRTKTLPTSIHGQNNKNHGIASICSKQSLGSFFSRVLNKGGSNSTNRKGRQPEKPEHSKSDSGFDSPCVGEGEKATGEEHSGDEQFVDFRFSRDFIASQSKTSRNTGRYVLKRVSLDLKHTDRVTFLKGTVDLALEAKFLSALDHHNIIQLTAVSDCGPFEEGYFLILPKLKETLSKRFKEWMNLDRQCKGITGVFTGSKQKAAELLYTKFEVSYDIACGMEYLHRKNIIFRDLKPDNIGFDTSGTLKLFDFGLAKELKPKDRDDNGLYRLTGFTGAVRYMAPEVGLGKPYNLAADVYSWSMIMWFMLALEPPFGFYTNDMIADRVFLRGSRPAIFAAWPESVSNVLRNAWSADISDRPSFKDVSLVLKRELIECDPTISSNSIFSSGDSLTGTSE